MPDDGPGARLRLDPRGGHGVHDPQRALQVIRAAMRARHRGPVPRAGRQAAALHVVELRAKDQVSKSSRFLIAGMLALSELRMNNWSIGIGVLKHTGR